MIGPPSRCFDSVTGGAHDTKSRSRSARSRRIQGSPLANQAEDFCQIVPDKSGNLTAQVRQVQANGSPSNDFRLSLTLYDDQGVPIVQSNGISADDPNLLIVPACSPPESRIISKSPTWGPRDPHYLGPTDFGTTR